MNPLSLFILSFLLLAMPCAAQTSVSLSGTVQDKEGKALQGANVIAYAEHNKILTYTMTDKEGHFVLNAPSGTTYVTVSFLGFNPITLPMEEFGEARIITLHEQTFKLREVAVTAERIAENGDTLTYSVAGFKQAQDRSIADVISKMPGLEVKPNGVIEYQGKAISNFYIEGLDLMGSQYSLASSNIPADKVKNVQVLENDQKVKSLRHIGFSEQAALNIVLKEDAKAVWSGLADLGLGHAGANEGVTYNNRLMGMQFGKRFQTLMMYKNNRTGADIGSEVQDIADLGGYQAERGLMGTTETARPDFDRQRYTFNDSHLLAGNWLWKTGKEADLRMQLSGYRDRERRRSESAMSYLTIEGIPVVTEDFDMTNLRNEIKGEVCYTLNTNRTYLRSSTRLYADWNSETGTTTCNDRNIDLKMKPYKRVLSEDLSLSHTTARGDVWQLSSSTGSTCLPGQLLILDGTVRRLDLHLFSTRNSISFNRRVGKLFVKNSLGLDYQHQDINGRTWQVVRPYWEPSIQATFGKHKLNGAMKVSYARQAYESASMDHLWPEPSFTWRWKASPKSELSFLYRLSALPLEGTSVVDTSLFTSYRNRYMGSGKTGVRFAHTVTAGYSYRNPVSGVFFNLRPMYSRSSGNVLYENTLDADVYTKRATDRTYRSDSYTVSSRLAKSFGGSRTTIGLNGSFSSTGYSYFLGNTVRAARLNLYSLSLDYSLRPFRWWTVEGKSGATVSSRTHASCVTDWEHFLDWHFHPAAGWMVSIDHELYHSNERGFGMNYFCDLSVGYKTGRWEVSFLANNLIGTSEYKRVAVSTTVQSYHLTRLRPREVMVEFSISF